MDKRRSSTKRSSRSSKYSIGSAVLDPDTNILGDEYPNWWKNLESNTIVRPSMDSNLLNQTSRHLDSNSQIEASRAADGWWKVLSGSNNLNISDASTVNIEKDPAKNTLSTSESEEEPRITKRKLSLLSKPKRGRGDIFLNILNDPEVITELKVKEKTKEKGSRNNSVSNNKTITNSEWNKMQESSSSHGSSINDVLKLKPKIFKKKTKNQNKNVFIDALQESRLQSPLKERSSKMSPINECQKITKHKTSSLDKADIANQAGTSGYMLSFENECDLSHIHLPKAQSTVLEGKGLSLDDNKSISSDAETEILKIKPKLLRRFKTSVQKNLFEDVFQNQEINDETEKSKINENIEENLEVGKQSSISLSKDKVANEASLRSIVAEREKNNSKQMKSLRSSKKSESAILLMHNNKESIKNTDESNLKSNQNVDTDVNVNTESKSLNCLNRSVNKKNKTKRYTIHPNILIDKSERSILNIDNKNVNEVEADVLDNSDNEQVSDGSDNEEITNKVQHIDKSVNTFQRMSAVDSPSNLNVKEQPNLENRSKRFSVSNRASNLATSSMKTFTDRHTNISKGQKTITNFFKSNGTIPATQVFSDQKKAEEIKRELEKIKRKEIECMQVSEKERETKSSLQRKKTNEPKKRVKQMQKQHAAKQVHKAFMVNGKVYKVPRLPHPKPWITDRLYNYLWKRMEPKYKLETRVVSEKFVRQLSNVANLIVKRKSYVNYKTELNALMKEMARLGIIQTRNDFYSFCQEFFPYELRIKTVPMLMPGNKRNIPCDADKLYEPLLDSS